MQAFFRYSLGVVVALCLAAGGVRANPDIALTLKGGDDALKERLITASRLFAADAVTDVTSQDFAAAALADYNTLIGVLYEEGYYGPTISVMLDGAEARGISPFSLPDQFTTAKIRVVTGPRFALGRAVVAPLPQGVSPPEGFKSGETARLDVIRAAGTQAVAAWQERGYAKADLARQRITANHASRHLDVDLGIDTGPQLVFGRFLPTGQRNVRQDRLRDIAGLPRGAVYDPAEVANAAARLRDTGMFRSVTLRQADEIRAENILDITAQLVEAKPRRFGLGAEVFSQEGLTLSSYWLHRNILGGAERLRFDAEVGGIGGVTGGEDVSLKGRFERPATFNPLNTLFVQGTLERLNEPDFTSDQFRVDLGIQRAASENLDVFYGVAYRRATIDDASGEESYTQLLFPLGATYDRRTGGPSATGGYYLSGEIMPFLGLNDTANGVRGTLDARAFLSLGETTVVGVRGQLGVIEGAKVDEVPADFQFYSGGGGTVRGQDYQSLGFGRGGGASFLGASVELRQGITDDIGVVGFVDYGFIGAEPGWDIEGDDHAGAGIGVRYETPIGPLRLDLATGLTGDSAGQELEIYIGIGQAF